MINVKSINKLLTTNADGRLIVRWFLTTPNGSLLAYTTPTDMRGLRDQVALVSMTWKQQLEKFEQTIDEDSPADHDYETAIDTVTMEFDNRNVLVKYIQFNLLLVLEGGVPPRKGRPLHITAEGPAVKDGQSESQTGPILALSNGTMSTKDDSATNAMERPTSPSTQSLASTTMSTRRGNQVLAVHRRKMEAMASMIRSQLEAALFTMPADPDNRFF